MTDLLMLETKVVGEENMEQCSRYEPFEENSLENEE